jgi:hypothetical protein
MGRFETTDKVVSHNLNGYLDNPRLLGSYIGMDVRKRTLVPLIT